mmetsp:Transcript_16985/g.52413  ORF Transcript_16985/g.52413 Transcript_16985/m.52413 type:complete len:466 (-) Transcript_16985:226-1623(-)
MLLIACSIALSRGLDALRAEMDPGSDGCLTAQFGHCTQELVNLCLAGRAFSNVFDGDYEMAPGFSLRGPQGRSAVGYLTHLEALRFCAVGDFLKKPRAPLWVVASSSHFTVLFATDLTAVQASPAELHLERARRAFARAAGAAGGPGGGGDEEGSILQLAALAAVLEELGLTRVVHERRDGLTRLQQRLELPGTGVVVWGDFWSVASRLLSGESLARVLGEEPAAAAAAAAASSSAAEVSSASMSSAASGRGRLCGTRPPACATSMAPWGSPGPPTPWWPIATAAAAAEPSACGNGSSSPLSVPGWVWPASSASPKAGTMPSGPVPSLGPHPWPTPPASCPTTASEPAPTSCPADTSMPADSSIALSCPTASVSSASLPAAAPPPPPPPPPEEEEAPPESGGGLGEGGDGGDEGGGGLRWSPGFSSRMAISSSVLSPVSERTDASMPAASVVTEVRTCEARELGA